MMAFDRTPSPPTLDAATVEALRAVLGRSAMQGNHVDELRGLLCQAAEEARTKGIQAERLLIILKDIWYSLPRIGSGAAHEGDQTLLQQLITRCIQEYYSA